MPRVANAPCIRTAAADRRRAVQDLLHSRRTSWKAFLEDVYVPSRLMSWLTNLNHLEWVWKAVNSHTPTTTMHTPLLRFEMHMHLAQLGPGPHRNIAMAALAPIVDPLHHVLQKRAREIKPMMTSKSIMRHGYSTNTTLISLTPNTTSRIYER